MVIGLPVVATDIRGSREEVVEGITGMLVPIKAPEMLGFALDRLAKDADLRQEWGAAGRVRAMSQYNESIIVRKQLKFLGLTKHKV